MVWVKSLKDDYVNVDNIISITSDQRSNAIVAVVGYKDVRLQHVIYHSRALDNVLQGKVPRSENEVIERIITCIEEAKEPGSPKILDFESILSDF
ncbi:MAG: hypothetical protein QCH35_01025 [Methanomicrobiaceae archaeon]|nr:hypothetical protein [Methanomicrobiaceae archaeon]